MKCSFPRPRRLYAPFLLLMGGLLLAAFSGCVADLPPAAPGPTARFSPAAPRKAPARVSVFLNLKRPAGPNIWIRFKAIELIGKDISLPLVDEPLEIDTEQLGRRRIFIARKAVRPGAYSGLRFTIDRASVKNATGANIFLGLASRVVEIPFSSPLSIARQDSQSIFVQWDHNNSLTGNAILSPSFNAAPQSNTLISNLAYVACPEIDTIYLIRTDNNWVVGSFGVSGQPTYLGIDYERNRLYVLAAREAAIKVFDLDRNRLLDQIQIPLTRKPSFMMLSPDGLSAYILEEESNYLIRINLKSGSYVTRALMGLKPQYLIYLEGQRLLAVSARLSRQVFLVDPTNLAIVDTIRVGNSPDGLLENSNLLYISESGSNTITAYDLSTRKLRNRLSVGTRPSRFLLHENRIYVTNVGDGTVSILVPGQHNVSREIYLGRSKPLEMAASTRHNWLYITDAGYKGITVIDPTSNRVALHIRLGTTPLGIAIVQ